MTFHEFVKRLGNVIQAESSTSAFTRTLFEAILDIEKADVLNEYKDSTFKAYYNGNLKISRIAKKIVSDVQPENFAEFIDEYEDQTIQRICDSFSDVITDMNCFNAGEKLGELFEDIICEAASITKTDRSDSIDNKSTLSASNLHTGDKKTDLILDEGLKEYLRKLYEKYDCIPTILQKESLKPFKEYYVANNITYTKRLSNNKRCSQKLTMCNVTLQKALNISRFLVLSGTCGLGKSMMMRNFTLSGVHCYEEIGLIPIFISLKDYENSSDDLVNYIYGSICNLWHNLDKSELIDLFELGRCLFLFDGLDELSIDDFPLFTKQLNNFIDRYSENAFVISSRPYSDFQAFTRFTVLHLDPLTKQQALELVDKLDYYAETPYLQKKFRMLLDRSLYLTHKGFSDNPLLLSIMILTFEKDADVPSVKHIFYQEAYNVLSQRHDTYKENYSRTLKTGWDPSEFSHYFAYFCAQTYKDGKVSFSYSELEHYFHFMEKKYHLNNVTADDFIYDAINNICIMYQDGTNYGFIHRSFQEYFFAGFIHGQLDEQLKQVIPIFDRNDRTKKDDLALPMLYDMKPTAVEKYLIYPYLNALIERCENKDGIWNFLETLYPNLELADGEAYADDDSFHPCSNLYSFILELYRIPLLNILSDSFDHIYLTESKTLVFREDIQADWWSDDLPDSYINSYGDPKCMGHIYRFDWKSIQADRRFAKLKIEIESPASPFVNEYNSIKELLEKLNNNRKLWINNDDPFANMF